MKNNILKRGLCVFLALAAVLSVLGLHVFAANEYQNNAHFKKTTAADATTMLEDGEKFILYCYRDGCANCRTVGAQILTQWMDDYGQDIYGVDVDEGAGTPSWVWAALGKSSATLPFVAFVQNGTVEAYCPETTIANYTALLTEVFDSFAEPDDGLPKVRILKPETTTLRSGKSVTLHASVANPPADAVVKWSCPKNVRGETTVVTGEGMNFTVTAEGGRQTVTVTAELYDADGAAVTVDGQPVIAQQNIQFKAGMFDWLYTAFPWLWNVRDFFMNIFKKSA